MVKSLITRFAVIIFVTAVAFAYLMPPFDKKGPDGQIIEHGKLRLGLDLSGGSSFLVEVDTGDMPGYQKSAALDEAIKIIRKRIDPDGVMEPVIQKVGENRILVQIPGISEEQKISARQSLERVAKLEFRLVHPRSDEIIDTLNQGGIPPAGFEVLYGEETVSKPGEPVRKVQRPYVVKIRPEMGGKYVTRAVHSYDNVGQSVVLIEMNEEGSRLFGNVTEQNVGNRLAIVMDGEVKSAPEILSAILGGRCEISGSFTPQEAQELASILENPLENPVKILVERNVGPSLAADSIRQGVNASLWATIGIVVFMAIYYTAGGVIADIALALNLILLLGLMVIFDASLTLPGIAGIVLVLGMAVDANVLIFERIREELDNGKGLKNAIAAGYGRAFWTIMDSNITTLVTAFILIILGTGPIKGFGVTLAMGLCVSLFTALFVTRAIMDLLVHLNILKSLPMLRLIRNDHKIDFLKARNVMFALSAIVIVVGFGWGINRGENVWGIDFKGGDTVVMKVKERAPLQDIRGVLEQAGLREFTPQYQRDDLTGEDFLQIRTKFDEGLKAEQILVAEFPNAGFTPYSMEKVGPVVGNEILLAGIISCIVGLIGILFYITIRFEFPFALGTIVGTVHDVLITLAVFMLCGFEFSAPIVAAILTIIGFSVNDTIVVFDRVRENLRLHQAMPLEEVMNLSVNQTLSRTILTSGTTLLASLALYIFGSGPLKDFAFTFGVGVIVGTLSTIYICSPVVLLYTKYRKQNLRTVVEAVRS
ncbi:protein translocase subunit SecD [Kamptonema cortianum]|nr:protein translocase subunit SecD [Kamptonema cortianum]MDL5046178.1 protein translocase subunit SecD [Oscillatoria amoena NRMC-F 0135]